MAVADALVLSSIYEELPGVGGTPELVEHGVSGHLVPPGDAAALAAAIERVILLPVESRKALGKAGRKIVEEILKVEFMVKAYEKLYLDSLMEKN